MWLFSGLSKLSETQMLSAKLGNALKELSAKFQELSSQVSSVQEKLNYLIDQSKALPEAIQEPEETSKPVRVMRRVKFDDKTRTYRLMTDEEAHSEEEIMRELGIL